MKLDELRAESVRTLPVIGETHWLKFYLAIKRFVVRYPHWNDKEFDVLVERTKFKHYPKVNSVLSESLQREEPRFSVERAPRLISRGLFPIGYLAAHDWYEYRGFADMILSLKERAIHEGTYLGHGWSVWCSFYEVLDHLDNRQDTLFAIERFAEFMSYAFRGYPSSDSRWTPPKQDDPGEIDFSMVFDATLHRPSFFGHNLLTLGYLLRHKDILSDLEWRVGLSTVVKMTETIYKSEEDNVVIDYPPSEQGPFTDGDLESAIRHLLFKGPKDVHSVTLADICYDLWRVADEKQQWKLLYYLKSFHE